MLRSGLSLYCYTLPVAATPLAVEYAEQLVGVQFTTLAPGGFGDLTAVLQLANPRLPRPELALFSHVAVMDGPSAVWIGELTDPELGMTSQDGEYIKLTALGVGNALRDDPLSIAYSNQTAKAVISDQVSRRSNYLPLDSDLSAVFPDNPTATFALAYDGRTMEEVVSDVALQQGGATGVPYSWGVWAHASHKDAMDFPTGQLVVHKQDFSTTTYQALLGMPGEITEYHLTPSAERAYNVVKIGYNAVTSGFGLATWTDPRLGSNGSQNTAPFRRRVYYRDLSSVTTIGSAQATAIATAYGKLYSNPTNKLAMTLKMIRDATGNALPLWRVQADGNLYIPDLAARSAVALPFTPQPGTNQFYLVQTTYTESVSGDARLDVQGDNFVDTANLQVARLQQEADLKARGGGTTGTRQVLGAAETGSCGLQWSAATTGNPIGTGVNFKAIMAQAPTSILLQPTSGYNCPTPTVSAITALGFFLSTTCNFTSGNQYGNWYGTYTTQGNCLLDVDEGKGTFDHHCDGCGLVRRGLRLNGDLIVTRGLVGVGDDPQGPGRTALSVVCPVCGAAEVFNTALFADDEDELLPHNYAHRAQQARLIRSAMRHPHVGLAVHGHKATEAAAGTPANGA